MSRTRLESNEARAIEDYVDARLQALQQHIDSKFDEHRQLFLSAFPLSDPAEHRRAHEDMIEAAAEWKELKRDLMKKGAWGMVGVVGMLLWAGLSQWLLGLIARGGK